MPTATTTDLARFLATTGPEQFAKLHHDKPTVMARLVRSHKKKKCKSAIPLATSKPHAKHIPLPVYIPPTPTVVPSSSPSSSSIPTFPEPPSATQSQVIAEQPKKTECPHCCRCVPPKKLRRTSCPPAIHYTPTKKPGPSLTSQEAKMLYTMIEKLQMQLVQEQASRQALEEALRNSNNNKEL